ncbi:peptidoglycan D,D-transpeptidase FtsI family protein [Ilumatobacter sp.]|uniref:peptidoglycan D,D-transpeptidase FtsI family protein n=1 Tax=Ilumatobacter sp. TaxID=1967498 RepID=UPI003B51B4CF
MPRIRLLTALVVLSVMLAAIVARVAMLKTSDAESFRTAGTEQWTRTIQIVPQRGTIFDRHGNELVISVPAAAISINPKLVDPGSDTIRLLADLLALDAETVDGLEREVALRERGFVYVARQVDASIGDQIDALNRAGVNVDPEARRELPGGQTGASVLGRTDIDGNGIAGLELQYDAALRGRGGSMTREIAPEGRTIPGSETVSEQPVAGDDLVLTIDRSIQYSTEQVLLDRVAEIGARGGLIVVMDTDTGEIYANASVRRDPDSGEPVVTNGNFVAVDSYEPGSVAKVITVAGALDAGSVSPDTTFTVPWKKVYADDELTDSHEHPTEVMTVSDILVESSNIGTIGIQERMGRFVHYDYMTEFGLGSTTALAFPDESAGIFKPVDQLFGSERVTVAYGQGMSSTPIQMVTAINTIANGGVHVEPKLVRATVGPDGTTDELPASPTRRVVSQEAAAATSEMMRRVVCDEDGTATRAAVPGLSIAGKTGTAFKAAGNGTYFDDEGGRIYYASFVGFFPSDDPQVTVLVALDEPPSESGDRFGGTAAAPVFAQLAPSLIHELGIQPADGSVGCEG